MTSSGTIPIYDRDARRASLKASRGSRGERARSRRTESDGRRDTDRLLVDQLLHRDPAAWKTFVSSTERLIYSRVLATCGELGRVLSVDAVEDCCAEVLSSLVKDDMAALRRFEGRSRLTTWLAVITRRVTLAKLTRRPTIDEQARRPDSRFDLDVLPDRRVGPVGELTSAADRERLQRCLRRLKETDRRALTLHFEERRSYRDIGDELSISENAVGPKLQRAQKRLRKLWEREERSAEQSGERSPDTNHQGPS